MALAWLSHGTCYFPGCDRRIIVFVEDEPEVDVHIAHIRDAKPGNRYVQSMSVDERRAFSNLILLCKPHHDLVDKTHPERYGIASLEQWKFQKEAGHSEQLAAEPGLSEEFLEDTLRNAVVNISVTGASLHVGGMGGSAPGSGGGGGGAIGGGVGGPGGPGGPVAIAPETKIVLEGQPGVAPGTGGGGAGVLLPGSVPKSSEAKEGQGFSSGVDSPDGGASWIATQEGEVLAYAEGGKGVLAGTGIRLDTDRLAVSTLMLANAWELRDSFAYVLGGAWQSTSILNLGDSVCFPLLIVFEAAGMEEGEYTVGVEVRGPDGVRRVRITFPVTVKNSETSLEFPEAKTSLPMSMSSAYGLSWWTQVEKSWRSSLS
jgi:hypothetical protein